MTAQPPAAPEGDARLTEAEKRSLISRARGDKDFSLVRNVERIVAERVRVVEGERDALRKGIEALADLVEAEECHKHHHFPGHTDECTATALRALLAGGAR